MDNTLQVVIDTIKEVKKKGFTTLSLSYNRMTNLPREIVEVPNITILFLGNNQLISLPKEIGELTNLMELYLYNNKLPSLPKEIARITKLTTLDLFNNELTSLPKEIGELTNLSNLNLRGNKLITLPKEIVALINLTTLDLYNNNLTSLPKEIGKLINLTTLDLYNNNLTSLPKEIGELEKLITLDLYNNNLTSLPKEITELKNLTHLNLAYNQLTSLPKEIGELKNLRYLTLKGNPLKDIPKEIYEKDNCIDYFISIQKETIQNHEIKLILLGNTTVGKTSLVNYLQNKTYNPSKSSTHGININTWNTSHENTEIVANIWDFGGQEYYHATHKLFLSSGALFLVVWEKETNKNGHIKTDIIINNKQEKENLEHYHYLYWLDSIKYYTKDSPVMMIQSKVDDKTGQEDLDPKCYNKKNYNVIKPCRHISVKKSYLYLTQKSSDEVFHKEFEIFELELKKHLYHCLLKYSFSIFWAKIRDGIKERKHENFWNFEKYKNYCYEIDNTIELDILTEFLHKTGVILFYGDVIKHSNSILSNIVFINPLFITNCIYEILDYTVLKNQGSFSKNHVYIKIQEYLKTLNEKSIMPNAFTEIIIKIMLAPNFELIFEHPTQKDVFIAPQYLSEEVLGNEHSIDKLNMLNHIAFVMYYPHFLPKSIISRFITRFGRYAGYYYKYGIFIEKNEAESYIYCDFHANKIYIKENFYKRNRQLINEIFDTLNKLNENNNEIELSIDDIDFVPINIIQSNSKAHIEKFTHEGKLFYTNNFSYIDSNFAVRVESKQQNNFYDSIIIGENMNIHIDHASGAINMIERQYSHYGITENEFNELKQSLISLEPELKQNFNKEIEQLKSADTPEKKKSAAEKFGKFLKKVFVDTTIKVSARV